MHDPSHHQDVSPGREKMAIVAEFLGASAVLFIVALLVFFMVTYTPG